MSRSLRIAAVTAGLLAAGALAGAVAADIAVLIGFALSGEPLSPGAGEVLGFVSAVGAAFGGVLLPATAWAFLRRVPIGLALLGTILGTIVGGVLGWIVHPAGDSVMGGVYGALIGFALAAAFLRIRASAPDRPRVSVRG